MRNIGMLLGMLAFPALGLAESEEAFQKHLGEHDAIRQEAVRHIPRLIETYASTVGCAFSWNPANVVPYQLDGKDVFVALYSLDVGCSGGSRRTRHAAPLAARRAGWNTDRGPGKE